MQAAQIDHAKDMRLRVVFDETVQSFNLSANATVEDIVLMLSALPKQRYGNPLSINVILKNAQRVMPV